MNSSPPNFFGAATKQVDRDGMKRRVSEKNSAKQSLIQPGLSQQSRNNRGSFQNAMPETQYTFSMQQVQTKSIQNLKTMAQNSTNTLLDQNQSSSAVPNWSAKKKTSHQRIQSQVSVQTIPSQGANSSSQSQNYISGGQKKRTGVQLQGISHSSSSFAIGQKKKETPSFQQDQYSRLYAQKRTAQESQKSNLIASSESKKSQMSFLAKQKSNGAAQSQHNEMFNNQPNLTSSPSKQQLALNKKRFSSSGVSQSSNAGTVSNQRKKNAPMMHQPPTSISMKQLPNFSLSKKSGALGMKKISGSQTNQRQNTAVIQGQKKGLASSKQARNQPKKLLTSKHTARQMLFPDQQYDREADAFNSQNHQSIITAKFDNIDVQSMPQNVGEDFSDLVQETIEADKPSFKDTDLRKSITASQREQETRNINFLQQTSGTRSTLLVSSSKSVAASVSVPDFNPFENHVQKRKELAMLDRKFDNLQVLEHSPSRLERIIENNSQEKKNGGVSSSLSMLKLYQNNKQVVSRQPGKIFPSSKEKEKQGANIDSSIIDDLTLPMNIEERDQHESAYKIMLSNEENLLEQTLGQTLTQQKQILDQINTQTQNRNHMQLMNRYLVGEDYLEDSAGKVGSIGQLTSQAKLSYEPRIQLSSLPKQTGIDMPRENSHLITGMSSGLGQNSPKQTNTSGVIYGEGNNSFANRRSSSALLQNRIMQALDQEKKQSQVQYSQSSLKIPKIEDKRLPMKVNTAKTSPGRKVEPSILTNNLKQAKDEASANDKESNVIPSSVMSRKPGHTAMGVHISKTISTPGKVMNNLKDRRSMSRIDGTNRRDGVALTINDLHSTGGKRQGMAAQVRHGLQRDFSMPKLRPPTKDNPIETIEDYLPNAIPKQQKQMGEKSKEVLELNMRLSYLNNLNGPSLLTPQYKSLRLIDIRNNKISVLPEEICSLQFVSHLKLDYNYLVALPFSLGSIRTLTHISASQNQLQELPDSIFHKDSMLQNLLVNDNKISILSKGLGKLVHLKMLFLHNNMLVEIPTSLCQLTQVNEFSIDWLLYVDEKSQHQFTVQSFNPSPKAVHGNDIRPSERVTITAPTNQEFTISGTNNDGKKDSQDNTRKNTQNNVSVTGNKKVLKGEKGITMIREIKFMLKFFDSAQRNHRQDAIGINQYRSIGSSDQPDTFRQDSTTASSSGYIHFLQFLMYFHQANNLSSVRSLTFSHKQRLLVHQLAVNGHLYLIKASIAVLGINRPETCLDLNAPDEDNSTALLLAMKQKKFDVVKYLLRLPVIKTNVYSLKYGLPLHVALAQSEFKLASKLIKTYSSDLKQTDSTFEVDVNVANEFGNTPLHLVFLNFQKSPEMATVLAKLLIKRGADLHCRNQHELGLLHLVVQTNNMLALKFALTHNRTVRLKMASRVNKKDKDVAKLFDFNGSGGKNQGTVLHHAIFHTNLVMITFLLTCGEFIDLTALDAHGKRAIDLCPYSSPIFKSIRDQTKRQVQSKVDKAFKDSSFQPMSQQQIGLTLTSSDIQQQLFSARECNISQPETRTIQTMQQLFMLKQLPADQFRQDVPPGPGPFPQKTLNYNSNQPESFYGGQLTFVGAESQRDESDFMLSDRQHNIAVPSNLQNNGAVYNDVAMNVPTSFDQRESHGASQGVPVNSRKKSNHLQLIGVTNPEKDAQSNEQQITTPMGRISSLKDEDNLNQHWIDFLNGDPNRLEESNINLMAKLRQHKALAPSKFDPKETMAINNLEEESMQSLSARFLPGQTQLTNNQMIYSTLAAAYPYSHHLTAEDLHSIEKPKLDLEKTMRPTNLPRPIETGNLLDLSYHHTEVKVNLLENHNNLDESDEDDDSGDNLDDIDEKERPPHDSSGLGRDMQVTPTSGIATVNNKLLIEQLREQVGTECSDGENVDVDEDDNQTKAFEARESQWNRKLSIKHTEEKKINQKKSELSKQIVKAFEEARNYHQNPATLIQEIQAPLKGLNVIHIPRLDLTRTSGQNKPKIADIAENEILNDKPLVSNDFSNKHSSPKAVSKQSQAQQASLKRLSALQTKQGSPSLTTHNFNLMSTVKVTDLKLHLNQNNAESIGAAESHRVFGGDHDQPLRGFRELEEMVEEVYIKEKDSQVLLWAYSQTSIKIKQWMKQLLRFIELMAVARMVMGPQEFSDKNLPSNTQLVFNLHELENLFLIKVNEVSQKQSMKLIIINSTGRHRRAPSEFQSAKTIKRDEMQPYHINRRAPSTSKPHNLRIGGTSDSNRDRFQQFEQKDYREEDSMVMYDSNMPTPLQNAGQRNQAAILSNNRNLVDQVQSNFVEPSNLSQSRSTQNFNGYVKVQTSTLNTLRDLIGEHKQINSTSDGSFVNRKRNQSGNLQQSASQPRIQTQRQEEQKFNNKAAQQFINRHQNRSKSNSKVTSTSRGRAQNQALRYLVEGQYNSSQRSRVDLSQGDGKSPGPGRVSIEGKANLGSQQASFSGSFFGAQAASTPDLRAMLPYKQKISGPGIGKKGVTSGMQLSQPLKKNDDVNLDLTMQVDGNEELQADEEGQTHLVRNDHHDIMMVSSDLPFTDEILGSPHIKLDARKSIQSRMIGKVQTFNQLMQSNKDNFDRRFTTKQIKHGRGIGMHLRQQDPLGSIALSSHESAHKPMTSSQSEHKKPY